MSDLIDYALSHQHCKKCGRDLSKNKDKDKKCDGCGFALPKIPLDLYFKYIMDVDLSPNEPGLVYCCGVPFYMGAA